MIEGHVLSSSVLGPRDLQTMCQLEVRDFGSARAHVAWRDASAERDCHVCGMCWHATRKTRTP
jgi:hypothetical protein